MIIMKTYRMYYERLVDLLVEETEFSKDEIMTSKEEDCVNVRIMMVYLMSEAGVTDKNIEKLTGFTQQMISRNKNQFSRRFEQSQTVRILTKITRKYITSCITDFRNEQSQVTLT